MGARDIWTSPINFFACIDVQTTRYTKSIKQPRKDCQRALFVREFITSELAPTVYQHERQKLAEVRHK